MFNARNWLAVIISSLSSYNALQDFITHKETIEFHVNKLTIQSHLVEDVNSINKIENKNLEELLRFDQIKQINEANQVYQKQMIVLIASYIEAIILDFLQSIFLTHPIRSYDYLNGDEKGLKGKVDLKEIVDADTKDQLINTLSIRAASNATRGKFKTTLNNLEKISRRKLKEGLSEKLILLVEQRNLIVHELANVDVINQNVLEGYDFLSDLLSTLGDIAQDNGVHVINPDLSSHWEEE